MLLNQNKIPGADGWQVDEFPCGKPLPVPKLTESPDCKKSVGYVLNNLRSQEPARPGAAGLNVANHSETDLALLSFLTSPACNLLKSSNALSRSASNFRTLSAKSCSVGSFPDFSYQRRTNRRMGAISWLFVSLQPLGPVDLGCFPQHGNTVSHV